MSARPADSVDWGVITPRLRPGDHTCTTHGVIVPETAPIGVPICPHCRHLASTVHFKDGKLNGFAEPAPAYCGAPERHRLTGGTVQLGWRACSCPATAGGPGGHREWRCAACAKLGRPSQQIWPPCAQDGA
jgi:hypothetical protein